MDMLLENLLDSVFEFDEVECVMIASGEELEEAADADVKEIEDDDENDDFYDRTLEVIGGTYTIEDKIVNAFRETRDMGMDSLNEDLIDSHMMDIDIDPDVEDIEDDDEDEDNDGYDYGDYIL